MHESIIKLNGYDFIKYADKYWLKIFHQNSRVCYFKSQFEANYSLNRNCFSILHEIDSRFKVNGNYSLLLEYPQIMHYIQWTQTSDFSYVANESQNYELVSKSPGSWQRFKGLHSYPMPFNKSLYIGDTHGVFWCYAIGTVRIDYEGVMPVNENEIWIQYVDLCLEIDDFEK